MSKQNVTKYTSEFRENAINQQKANHCVSLLCRFMKVSRIAYYHWLKVTPSDKVDQEKVLAQDINFIFKASRKTYGVRLIKQELALKASLLAENAGLN